MKKIYITGVSGTGKSTIAKEFSKRGIYALDIEDVDNLCNWVDKKTGEKDNHYKPTRDWLDAHDWIVDIEKLKQILNTDEDLVIVTGISTNQDEYLSLFDKIFLLQCREEIFLKRLASRHLNPGENDFGKYSEERGYALEWYKEFEEKLIKRNAIIINAEEPINIVADTILSKV